SMRVSRIMSRWMQRTATLARLTGTARSLLSGDSRRAPTAQDPHSPKPRSPQTWQFVHHGRDRKRKLSGQHLHAKDAVICLVVASAVLLRIPIGHPNHIKYQEV